MMDSTELRRLIANAKAERRGAIRVARARQRQWRAEIDQLSVATWQARAGFDATEIAGRMAGLIRPNGTTSAPAACPANRNDGISSHD